MKLKNKEEIEEKLKSIINGCKYCINREDKSNIKSANYELYKKRLDEAEKLFDELKKYKDVESMDNADIVYFNLGLFEFEKLVY